MTGIRLGSCALATAALFCSGIVADAQETKAPRKSRACNAIKTQATCQAREDCTWVAEVRDQSGGITRKAYCRAKSKARPK